MGAIMGTSAAAQVLNAGFLRLGALRGGFDSLVSTAAEARDTDGYHHPTVGVRSNDCRLAADRESTCAAPAAAVAGNRGSRDAVHWRLAFGWERSEARNANRKGNI
jgi:hypothetical protein